MPTENRSVRNNAGEAANGWRGFSAGATDLKRRENHEFTVKFAERLFEAGFKVVNEREIAEKLVAAGLWEKDKALPVVKDDEFIFNRGIGNPKSNFFVFLEGDRDGVTVFFGNPAAPKGAKPNELDVRFRFVGGDVAEAAEKAAREVLKYSAMKPENEYRAVTHHHWGFVGTTRLIDDGVSRFEDSLRMMMRCHMDLDMSTPHNTLETRLDRQLMARLGIRRDAIRFLGIIEEGLGIVKVPGTELTMPIRARGPNGPHVCVWLADKDAMGVFAEEILAKRDPALKTQSLFTGMGFPDMRKILQKMIGLGMCAVGIAHPINYNSSSLPVLDVGLISASVHGGMGFVDAIEFARGCQAVGCWNPTMSDEEIPTRGKEWRGLRPRFVEWMDEHNSAPGQDKFWARHNSNSLNMVFAEHMQRTYGVGMMFDGDDHQTRPLRGSGGEFNPGGDIMNMGHTRFVVGKEQMEKLAAEGRKPSPKEIVQWLVAKNARMEAVVHLAQGEGAPAVEPYRRYVPDAQKATAKMLADLQMQAYSGEILGDVGHFLGTWQWGALRDITG